MTDAFFKAMSSIVQNAVDTQVERVFSSLSKQIDGECLDFLKGACISMLCADNN